MYSYSFCINRYVTLEKHLVHLNNQLARCREDLETLKQMKAKALECPDDFISFLATPQSREAFPTLQKIMRIPNLDVHRYQIRLTRRANTRFEQNLDYLLSRAQEIHSRQASMDRPVSSIDFLVDSQTLPNSNKRSFNYSSSFISGMRNEFLEALRVPGSLSISQVDSYINPTSSMPLTAPSTPVNLTPTTVHQPRPRQAVREDLTDLNPMDYHVKSLNSSRPSSVPPPPPVPLISTPVSMMTTSSTVSTTPSATNSIKIRIRKASSQTPEQTSITHNIPWSDDEKRKLEYLLTVFPEEDIQARRYAKIAAALGTRTGNQVASRVQKLGAKAQRNKEKALKAGGVGASNSSGLDEQTVQLVAELEKFFADSTDPKVKETPEYAEYLRLKGQLESIAANPINGVLHIGFKCDCCGVEPIIGPRWTCCSCPKEAGPIDLCGGCVSKGFQTVYHKQFHVMKKIDFSEDSELLGDEEIN